MNIISIILYALINGFIISGVMVLAGVFIPMTRRFFIPRWLLFWIMFGVVFAIYDIFALVLIEGGLGL